jgi:SAM-dependent methyltransferase
VLVVGAGAGNDVAGALAAGAWAVDAVEIDPLIAGIGRDRHPTRPYASPAVHLTVTDARAFFRRATGPYDLVWFGLLDSHTTPSAYANVRLDHFVYTRESLAEVKRLLAPSGWWSCCSRRRPPGSRTGWPACCGRPSESRQWRCGCGPPRPASAGAASSWWADRARPLAPVRARAAADPEVAPRIIDPGVLGFRTRLTTDDWPYLYLPRPMVPR